MRTISGANQYVNSVFSESSVMLPRQFTQFKFISVKIPIVAKGDIED